MEHRDALSDAVEAIERMLSAVRAASEAEAASKDVYEHLRLALQEMGPLHKTLLSIRTEAGLRMIDELPADPPSV